MNNQLTTLKLKDELDVVKTLENIWKEYFAENQNPVPPLFQEELVKNAVTYLSLNPSFPSKRQNEPLKESYPLIDFRGKESYPFYKKFFDIGLEISEPWTVLDLFYIRESKQEELDKKFNTKSISDQDKQFLLNQMQLTFKIIMELNPKVVVISNVLSGKLIHKFHKELNLTMELPNNENGWIYRINGIPYITKESSYLGSRFLINNIDRRKILVAEIKRVLAFTQKH